MIDKLPPTDIETEERLIGAILVSPATMLYLPSEFSQECFDNSNYRLAYETCLGFQLTGKPIDLASVSYEVEKVKGDGGRSAVLDAFTRYNTTLLTHSPVVWADKLLELWQRRKLIQECWAIAESAFVLSRNVNDISAEAEDRILALRQQDSLESDESGIFQSVHERQLGEIEAILSGEVVEDGARTDHLYDLDNALGGRKKGQLSMEMGATNIGKSQWAIFNAYCLARNGHTVHFISCEMSEREVWGRLISAHTGINNALFHNIRQFTPEIIAKIKEQYPGFPAENIYITKMNQTGIPQLQSALAQSELEFGRRGKPKAEVVVIDYLQIFAKDANTTEVNFTQRIDSTTLGLKKLAGTKDTHIMLLAQVDGNALEKRNNKRPGLQDPSYCKTAANHCDIVVGLYRDDYYDEHSQNAGVFESLILKHRHLPLSTVKLLYDFSCCRFMSMAGGGIHA